jgi:hypothetical protein
MALTKLKASNLSTDADEHVDDRIAALIVGGNNITATYNDAAGTLTIDGQPGYADSDVAAYLGGNLDTSIIPDTNATYDIGSASYKIRDLYLSNNSLHIGENILSVNASKLLFNGEDVMDYANVTSKPTTLTGYGITDGYADSDVATYLSGNGYATSTSIIADITASAPSTLDTLNELAAALGDDPNFATTVTNSIATKLPLAGGTLTGGINVTSGNVGIGTSSPPNPLSVRKTTTAYEDVISIIGQNSPTDIMGALAYDQATDLMIIRNDQIHVNGGIAFRAGGTSNHLFIKTGGNVGIGRSDPARTLDVHGSVNISVNTASHETFVFTTQAADDAKLLMQNASADTAVQLSANGTTHFNGGNVGIGTSSPVNVLQIGSSWPITMNGSYPDIHFNGYYSAPSYRTFTTGFGSKLTFNGSTGKLTISTGASSTTAGSDYSPVEIFGLDKSGNLAVDGGIKLGDDTRTAATSGAGALRWNSGKLQNSNGSDWKDVSYDPLGSSVLAPADSADAIVTAGDWNGDGFYWISTPNNGTMSTYCIKDTNGAYMVIGKFAANAKDTVQSTITTANVTVQDSSGTVFSSAFGDFTTNEIRFIGTDSIEGNWASTRNIDFIHGQSNRAWKNCFYESSYAYVNHPGVSGLKPGYWCTYAKDGRGRWSNTDYRSHAMSDGFNQITQAAFTTPGSFYMEQSGDAKFTVMNTGEASGQDGIVSAGFGNDDEVEGFFDLYPSTTTNMGGGNTYSTAVYVLIR